MCHTVSTQERRLNYTMELEGKLQGLSVESDKLRSQLNSIGKQEGKLTATKADLTHQVGVGVLHVYACVAVCMCVRVRVCMCMCVCACVCMSVCA